MEESSPAVSRSGSLPPGIGTPEESRPPPSPLSGAYLLVIISEPQTDAHKAIILQKLAKAFLSWNTEASGIDIERELAIVTALCPEGDFAKNGERLIQNASEHLVTEILIHPQVNTMRQCIRNLLSSFTKYRFIIHSGYAFCGSGSWILQDGTFSTSDFIDTFQEIEVQRVIRAYEKTVKIDICCISEGTWNQSRINQEPFTRICQVEINPSDKISPGNVAVREFVDYLERFISPTSIQELLEPSDIVGNIRFTHPTLYVFPGGEGDAALFGINGFNMLVDGGFSRKACFWNFVRHLDRLDGVLLTRINNSNMGGMSGIVQRKVCSHVYPQIGHFFSNLQTKRSLPSPDGDKDKEPLLVNLIDEGHKMVLNLKKLELKPHHCYRDPNSEPVNLYHKVGHGKLDMYIISPAKDSKEVKEFLSRWNNYDAKLFGSTSKSGSRELRVPLQNLVSICALLVWQPANPEAHVTRILFPGSAPQNKIFEGFEKMKQLEFLKNSVCTMKLITPVPMTMLKKQKISSEIITDSLHKGDGRNILGENEVDSTHKNVIELKKPKPRKIIEKAVPKEKSEMKTAIIKSTEKITDNSEDTVAKIEEKKKIEVKKIVPKPVPEKKFKPPSSLGPADRKSESEKSSPTTPKRTVTSIKVTNETIKDEATKPIQESQKSRIVKPTIDTKSTETQDPLIKSIPRASKGQLETKEKTMTKEPALIKGPAATKEMSVKEQTSKASETNRTVVRSTSRTQTPPKVFHAAKSLKDENNRKVAEAKKETRTRTPPKITSISKPLASKKDEEISAQKTEKKSMPIKKLRLPAKAPSTQSSAPVTVKKVRPLKIDETKKILKKDLEKTDSSALSTPSTLDVDAVHNLMQGGDLLEMRKVNHKIDEVPTSTDEESKPDKNVTTYVANIYKKEGHSLDNDDDDEILVIETTEMKQIDYEEQKYLRDEKESEKKKEQEMESEKGSQIIDKRSPLEIDTSKNLSIHKSPSERKTPDSASSKDLLTPEEKDKISDEVEGIISTATKLVSLKDDDAKSTDNDQRRHDIEKDEKIAFESASTTTAPTMPEDEKVDDAKQEIEEKYDKEETKEKSIEIKLESEIRRKDQKVEDARKSVSKKDVKTPDEVADLPVDDEAEANLQQEERDKLHNLLGEPTIMQPITDIVELKHAEYVTITPTPVSSPDEKPSPKQELPDETLKLKSGLISPIRDQLSEECAPESLKPEVSPEISRNLEDQGGKKEDTTKIGEPIVPSEVYSLIPESIVGEASILTMKEASSSQKQILPETLPTSDSVSKSSLPSHTIESEKEKIDQCRKLSITDSIKSDTQLPDIQSPSPPSPKDIASISISNKESISPDTAQINISENIIDSKIISPKKFEHDNFNLETIDTKEHAESEYEKATSPHSLKYECSSDQQELLRKISLTKVDLKDKLVTNKDSEKVISPTKDIDKGEIGNNDACNTSSSSCKKSFASESLLTEIDDDKDATNEISSVYPQKFVHKPSLSEKYESDIDSETVPPSQLDDIIAGNESPHIIRDEIKSDSTEKPEKDLSLDISPPSKEMKDKIATKFSENQDDSQLSQSILRKESLTLSLRSEQIQLSEIVIPASLQSKDTIDSDKPSITQLSPNKPEEMEILSKSSEQLTKNIDEDSKYLPELQRKHTLSKSTTEPILKDEVNAPIKNKTHSLEEKLSSKSEDKFILRHEIDQPDEISNRFSETEQIAGKELLSSSSEDMRPQTLSQIEIQTGQSKQSSFPEEENETVIKGIHLEEEKVIKEKHSQKEDILIEKQKSRPETSTELEAESKAFLPIESLPYKDTKLKTEGSIKEESIPKHFPDKKSQISTEKSEKSESVFIQHEAYPKNTDNSSTINLKTQETESKDDEISSKLLDKSSSSESVEILSQKEITNEITSSKTRRKASMQIDEASQVASEKRDHSIQESLKEAENKMNEESALATSNVSPVLLGEKLSTELISKKVDIVLDMLDTKDVLSISNTVPSLHAEESNKEEYKKQVSQVPLSSGPSQKSSPEDAEFHKPSLRMDQKIEILGKKSSESEILPQSVDKTIHTEASILTDLNSKELSIAAPQPSENENEQVFLHQHNKNLNSGLNISKELKKEDILASGSSPSNDSKISPNDELLSILSKSMIDKTEISSNTDKLPIRESIDDVNVGETEKSLNSEVIQDILKPETSKDISSKSISQLPVGEGDEKNLYQEIQAVDSVFKSEAVSPPSSISPTDEQEQLLREIPVEERLSQIEIIDTRENEVKLPDVNVKSPLEKSKTDAQSEEKKTDLSGVSSSIDSLPDTVSATSKQEKFTEEESISKHAEDLDSNQRSEREKLDLDKSAKMESLNVENKKSKITEELQTQEKMVENSLITEVILSSFESQITEETIETEKDEKSQSLKSDSNILSTEDGSSIEGKEKLSKSGKESMDDVEEVPQAISGIESSETVAESTYKTDILHKKIDHTLETSRLDEILQEQESVHTATQQSFNQLLGSKNKVPPTDIGDTCSHESSLSEKHSTTDFIREKKDEFEVSKLQEMKEKLKTEADSKSTSPGASVSDDSTEELTKIEKLLVPASKSISPNQMSEENLSVEPEISVDEKTITKEPALHIKSDTEDHSSKDEAEKLENSGGANLKTTDEFPQKQVQIHDELVETIITPKSTNMNDESSSFDLTDSKFLTSASPQLESRDKEYSQKSVEEVKKLGERGGTDQQTIGEFIQEQNELHDNLIEKITKSQRSSGCDKIEAASPSSPQTLKKVISDIDTHENKFSSKETSVSEKSNESDVANSQIAKEFIQEQTERHDNLIEKITKSQRRSSSSDKIEVASPTSPQVLKEVISEIDTHGNKFSIKEPSVSEKSKESDVTNLQSVEEFIQEQTEIDNNLIETIIKTQKSHECDNVLTSMPSDLKLPDKEYLHETSSDEIKLKKGEAPDQQTFKEFLFEETELQDNLIEQITKSQRSSIIDKMEVSSHFDSQIPEDIESNQKECLDKKINDTEILKQGEPVDLQTAVEFIKTQTEREDNLIDNIIKSQGSYTIDKSDSISPVDSKLLKTTSSDVKFRDKDSHALIDDTEEVNKKDINDQLTPESCIQEQTRLYNESIEKITKSHRSSISDKIEATSSIDSKSLKELSTETASQKEDCSDKKISDPEKFEESKTVNLQTAQEFIQEQIEIDQNLIEKIKKSQRSSIGDKIKMISLGDSQLTEEALQKILPQEKDYSDNLIINSEQLESVTDFQIIPPQEQTQIQDNLIEKITMPQERSRNDKIETSFPSSPNKTERSEDTCISSKTKSSEEEFSVKETSDEKRLDKSQITNQQTVTEFIQQQTQIHDNLDEKIIESQRNSICDDTEITAPITSQVLKDELLKTKYSDQEHSEKTMRNTKLSEESKSVEFQSNTTRRGSTEELKGQARTTGPTMLEVLGETRSKIKSYEKEDSAEVISDKKMKDIEARNLQTAKEFILEQTEIYDELVDQITKSQRGSIATDEIEIISSKNYLKSNESQLEMESVEKDNANIQSLVESKDKKTVEFLTAQNNEPSEIYKDSIEETTVPKSGGIILDKIEATSPSNQPKSEETQLKIDEKLMSIPHVARLKETDISSVQTNVKQSEIHDKDTTDRIRNPTISQTLKEPQKEDETTEKKIIGELTKDTSQNENVIFSDKLKINVSNKPMSHSYDSEILKDSPMDHTQLRKKSFPDEKTHSQDKTNQLTALHRHTLTSIKPEIHNINKSTEEITSEMVLENAAATEAINEESCYKNQVHKHSAEEDKSDSQDMTISSTQSNKNSVSDILISDLGKLKEKSTELDKLTEQLVNQKKILDETSVIQTQDTTLEEKILQFDQQLATEKDEATSNSSSTCAEKVSKTTEEILVHKDIIQSLDRKKSDIINDKLATEATSKISTGIKSFDTQIVSDIDDKVQEQIPQEIIHSLDQNQSDENSISKTITIAEDFLSIKTTSTNEGDMEYLEHKKTFPSSIEKIETTESENIITSKEFLKEKGGVDEYMIEKKIKTQTDETQLDEAKLKEAKSKTLSTKVSLEKQNNETDNENETNIIEKVKDFINQERSITIMDNNQFYSKSEDKCVIKSDPLLGSPLKDQTDIKETISRKDLNAQNESSSKNNDVKLSDTTLTSYESAKISQKDTSSEKQSDSVVSKISSIKTQKIDPSLTISGELNEIAEDPSKSSQSVNKSPSEDFEGLTEYMEEIKSKKDSSQDTVTTETTSSFKTQLGKNEGSSQLTSTLVEKQSSSYKSSEEKIEKLHSETISTKKVTSSVDNDNSIPKEFLKDLGRIDPSMESTNTMHQTDIDKITTEGKIVKEESTQQFYDITESPLKTFTTHLEETVTNIATDAITKLDDTANVKELIKEISDQIKCETLETSTEYYVEKYHKEPEKKETNIDENAQNQLSSTTYVTTTSSAITMDDKTYSTMVVISKGEIQRDETGGSNTDTITTITRSSPIIQTSTIIDNGRSQPCGSIKTDQSYLPISPELQLDTTQMRVKFTTDKKDDDESKRSTLKYKSNSEEFFDSSSSTQDVVGDLLLSKFEKREPVAKTVSLPLLDEKFEDAKTNVEVEKNEDFSRSYPHLEKISNNEIRTSTNLSDPTLAKQIQGELQSKSVSLPVIKQPDDSEQYMTLPHLYKTNNLEDLTSNTVLQPSVASNTQECQKSEENTAVETIREESVVIEPIKETEEPVEDTYTFVKTIRTIIIDDEYDEGESATITSTHSTDKVTEVKLGVLSPDEKASSLQQDFTSQSDISTEKSILSSYIVDDKSDNKFIELPSTTDISHMSASMTQSFYGSYPDDDSDNDQEKSEDKSEINVSASRKDSTNSPKKDPIGDWGKPLGLPDERSMSTLLVWNPLEDWGKPLGLPSPTPTPIQDGQHRESNGDIEITLAPVNTKGTPKRMVKKPPEKNQTARDTSKNRDNAAKKTKSSKQGNPLYVDLAYVPHHGNPYYTTVEFFKRIRARYYVFSGTDPNKDVFNALLEGKKSWENQDLEVTIISTYDTDVLGYWITENEETLANLRIDLAPSASRCTINLQDHDTSCSAYRLEF